MQSLESQPIFNTSGHGVPIGHVALRDAIEACLVKSESALSRALATEQFFVVYQPFVLVATGEVVGVEALARWDHPDEGQIGPSCFIPRIESSGLIQPFSEWLVRRVLEEARDLSNAGRGLFLSVNLPASVLAIPEFSRFLLDTVPVAARGRMLLDIARGAPLSDAAEEHYEGLLRGLLQQGFRFAIDDFGTGYSDLRRAVRFPAAILKTHVGLVCSSEHKRRGNAALNLVADLARGLDMRLLAEGVEDREQWERIKNYRVDYAKGFLFSPPLAIEELRQRLASHSPWRPVPPGNVCSHPRDDSRPEGGVAYAVSERPVLVVDALPEGEPWECALGREGVPALLRASLDSATRMLEFFDFSLCVLRLTSLRSEHHEFLERRRRFQPDLPVVAIADALPPEQIIEAMRGGVSDCVLRPDSVDAVADSVAAQMAGQDAGRRSLASSEKMERHLRDRMEWDSYRESRMLSADNRFGQKTIKNLRVSLTQGAGFGAILSAIDLMEGLSQNGMPGEGTAAMLRLLVENGQVARKQIHGLDAVVNLMGCEFQMKRLGSREFLRIVTEPMVAMRPHFERRRLSLCLPDWTGWGSFTVEIDPAQFQAAVHELAVNACKYALPGSEVDLVATMRAGYLCLGLKNSVSPEPYGGVSDEMAEQVTEPFYRLHPPVEDAVDFEIFGMGLGLTAVKYIMHRHRGMLSIRDVRDHTRAVVRPAVLASVYLPFEAGLPEARD